MSLISFSIKSIFSSHSGSPPNKEKFLNIPLADIACNISLSKLSYSIKSPPVLAHVSGL